MNISVIIPIEYEVGASIDLSRFGFACGTGIVTGSFRGRSIISYEIPHPEDTKLDRLFSLAAQVFGLSKEKILSRSRQRDLADCRMAMIRALTRHGKMGLTKAGEVMKMHHSSVNYYKKRWSTLPYMNPELKSEILNFDRQARIIMRA